MPALDGGRGQRDAEMPRSQLSEGGRGDRGNPKGNNSAPPVLGAVRGGLSAGKGAATGDPEDGEDTEGREPENEGQTSKKARPRKKAAAFDDVARVRLLRYRVEKSAEHVKLLETMSVKELFEHVAPDFCGTRYPEYSYTASELHNLDRSLRRTFAAYDEKGFESDRTLRLQGKAPPKPDLWDVMKQFYGPARTVVARAASAPPNGAPREEAEDFEANTLEHNRSTRAASAELAEPAELEILTRPRPVAQHEANEEVVEESDEESRFAAARVEYVDESDEDSRAKTKADFERKQRWQYMIGAAKLGADNSKVTTNTTRASAAATVRAPGNSTEGEGFCLVTHEKELEDSFRSQDLERSEGDLPATKLVKPPKRATKTYGKKASVRQSVAPARDADSSDLAEDIEIPPQKPEKEPKAPKPNAKEGFISALDRFTFMSASSDSEPEPAVPEPAPARKKKRGRPRKQDNGERPEKPKRVKKDDSTADGEPKPKKPRAPRKKKAKDDAIMILDTEREPVVPPALQFDGPFLTDFPTRSVHFLRVTDFHLMQVVLYLKKKSLDGWWSEARFQDLMLCLRCELAAKLERESKAKTKGLADIQRYPNFAMSYYLSPHEIDHSYLLLPNTDADRYQPLYVYPLAMCVLAEPPRAIGLPDFWGIKFAKQVSPPKVPKKPRVKKTADGAADGSGTGGTKKKQVLLTDLAALKPGGGPTPPAPSFNPFAGHVFAVDSDEEELPTPDVAAAPPIQPQVVEEKAGELEAAEVAEAGETAEAGEAKEDDGEENARWSGTGPDSMVEEKEEAVDRSCAVS